MESGAVCVGCLCSKNLSDLDTPVPEIDSNSSSNYKKLFNDVFSLEVPESRQICTECMEKLRNAAIFKSQVVNSLDFIQESKIFAVFLDGDDDDGVDGIKTENDIDEEPLQKIKDLMKDKPEITLIKQEVGVDYKRNRHRATNKTKLQKQNKKKVVIKWKNSSDVTYFLKNKKSATARDLLVKSNPKREKKVPQDYQYSEADLTCEECGKVFESVYQLNRHRNTHNPEYMCDVCGSGFRNQNSLRSHKDTHKPGPHVCLICNKEFSSLNSMRSHKRTHSASVYPCKICGERLRTYHSQRVHLQNVHGVKLNLYKCTQCDKTFITSTKRSAHIRTSHLKTRPHKCPQCELMFSAPAVLRAHLANAHGIGEKAHRCEFCEKRFSRRYTLLEHRRIHLKDFRFACHLCDKRFIQKCSLKSHMKNNHSQRYSDDGS